MKLHQIITEVPLPSDWDESVFTGKTGKLDFQKQLAYALERVKRSESGSGRMAFEIEYKGRPTILKIARSQKGLLQNASEARPEMYRKFKDVVVPLIDYDLKNKPPRWVHFEMAEALREDNQWKQHFNGMSIYTFAQIVDGMIKGLKTGMTKFFEKKYAQSIAFAKRIAQLCKEYDIKSGDLATIQNWGVYRGKIVMLDLGMDSASAVLYDLDLYH